MRLRALMNLGSKRRRRVSGRERNGRAQGQEIKSRLALALMNGSNRGVAGGSVGERKCAFRFLRRRLPFGYHQRLPRSHCWRVLATPTKTQPRLRSTARCGAGSAGAPPALPATIIHHQVMRIKGQNLLQRNMHFHLLFKSDFQETDPCSLPAPASCLLPPLSSFRAARGLSHLHV